MALYVICPKNKPLVNSYTFIKIFGHSDLNPNNLSGSASIGSYYIDY